ELRAERVSADLFPLLGAHAIVGRTFRPEEDRPGRADFVLLSHRLWERRFGANGQILDRTVVLSGRSYTVLGILPPGFAVLDPAVDVWLPLAYNNNDTRVAGLRTMQVIGRLKAGVSIEQARAEMDTLGAALERANPGLNAGWRPSPFWLREEIVGKVQQP